MPKKGYKSITVSDEIYDKMYKLYECDMEHYKEKGIFSFSGYVTQVLFESKQTDNFNDLKELLVINNSLLIGMFDSMLGADKETSQHNLLTMKMAMFEFIKNFKEKK